MLLQADAFEAIAVVIVASQKSAPVAVTVISYITGDVSAQGLLAIPAIVGQLTQIFMGSAISTLVAKYVSEPWWLHAPLFCLNCLPPAACHHLPLPPDVGQALK